jgi:type IV secretory pathway VirB4 component
MLGGNLSNKQAPYVMFDMDSLMFVNNEEKSVIDKVTDFFKSEERKYLDREIDTDFANTLERVWRKHNVCVGIFSFHPYDFDELEVKLYNQFVPYTRIFYFQEWEDLRRFNHSIYTFSNNEELLSYLSRKDAMKLERIWEVL